MDLKTQKIKVELSRIEHAKLEMELKIMERLEDIDRIKKNLEVQELAILEKKKELTNLSGGK